MNMSPTNSSPVLFHVEDRVAVITLNRPAVRNAFNAEMGALLAGHYRHCDENDAIRAVVVTGTPPAFCAGADMSSGGDTFRPRDEDFTTSGVAFRPWDVRKPVIAAINGHAIAGGMEIVQGTDIRVSVPAARFGVQEVKWAIFPAGGSTVRLPAQMPFAKAMELLLTGDLVTADEALHLGFLNHVTDDPLAKALEIAARIAANGPLAVRAIRRSARACLGKPEAEALALEHEISAPVFLTEDAREGPRAFMEKRAPVYHGR